MAESLIEQLDQALAAIQANPKILLPVNSEIDPLVSIAAALRDLPRKDFQEHLANELQSRASSRTSPAGVIRAGFRTVTPYIAVREANEVIDFVKGAFGAEGTILGTGSEGGLHAELRIGESMLMIGGGRNWQKTPRLAAIHLYVGDVDAVYERALQFGATSLMGPTDQTYGDRDAAIQDISGNHWYIATHLGTQPVPPDTPNLLPYLHPRGAAKMIDFLKNAFAAEELARYQSPEGYVQHAKVKIGNSIVEIGEAHAQWQPMPAMFYLYVEAVESWYERAIAGGATPVSEPADQPYGDRTAAVEDSFANLWYIATHLQQAKR